MMSQKSETLTNAVRRLAAAERAAEGATLPTPEDLVAYRDGKLEGAAREALERALSLNSEAVQEYLDLVDPSRLAAPGQEDFFTDQDAQRALLTVRKRIREEESRGLEEEGFVRSLQFPLQDHRARKSRWGSRLKALAAVLILAVAGTWIFRLHQLIEERSGPHFAAVVDVSPNRGVGRSLPVPEKAGEILLILHDVHLGAYSRGELEMTDSRGRRILARKLTGSHHENTLLYLPVPQSLLPHGRYRIEIYGIGSEGRQLVEEYALNLVAPSDSL